MVRSQVTTVRLGCMPTVTYWMHWYQLLLLLGWLGVVESSSHVSITRTNLPHANVISLQPQGWLSRAVKPSYLQTSSSPTQSNSKIREVVYIASHLTLHQDDLEDDDCLSDNHFCSLLCDRGLTVHIIRPKLRVPIGISDAQAWSVAAVSLGYMEAISRLVKSRMVDHRVPGNPPYSTTIFLCHYHVVGCNALP